MQRLMLKILNQMLSDHMTNDDAIFKKLDKSYKSRVEPANVEYINVKGKGAISIEISSCRVHS